MKRLDGICTDGNLLGDTTRLENPLSDIRLNNQSLYTPTFSPMGGGAPLSFGPNVAEAGPLIGTPLSLLGGENFSVGSDPAAASRVLMNQSHIATAALGGNEPSAAEILTPAEQAAKGASTVATGGGQLMDVVGRNAGRFNRIGAFGPTLGVAGELAALPNNYNKMSSAIGTAVKTGERDDVVRAGGETATFASGAASLVRDGLEVPGAWMQAGARREAAAAFRTKAPNASRKVVNAASRKAVEEAMKESTAKAARKATTSAATAAAKKGGGTLAQGAGVVGHKAAKKALAAGGKSAATAAGGAIARSGLKTAAKAGARFVPGLNIAIAGLDTAAAAATLADPKASVGKKATSVITAAGSIVAATNIPVVSQIGAGVSAVSSFVGSFF